MSLEYKGYVSGPISYDDGVFSAVVEGLRDVIHFEGATAKELEQAFKDSIEDYLAMCQADGVEPDRAFSGQFVVRTDSGVHRNAALCAAAEGKSLNQWVSEALRTRFSELPPNDIKRIKQNLEKGAGTGRIVKPKERLQKTPTQAG